MTSVWFIFKYEMKKFFRERTSIFFIIIPMCVFPLTMILLNSGQILLKYTKDTNTVAIVNRIQEDGGLEDIILKREEYTYIPYESLNTACKDLKKGRIVGIIYMKSQNDADASRLHFIYDPNSMSSMDFLQNFSQHIQDVQKDILQNVERRFSISNIDISYKAESYTAYLDTPINDIAISILPVIIITFALFSGSTIATDTITGEKERGTFEDLLLVNTSFSSIIFAKTLFVYAVLLLETISAVLGTYAAIFFGGFFPAMLKSASSLGITSSMLFQMTFLLNIFILCISAFMVYVGILSRNMRSANLKLNIFSLIPCFFSFFLLYFNTENCPNILYHLPIMNTMVAVKFLLMRTLNTSSYVMVNLTNVLYLLLLIVMAKRALLSEKNVI